MENRMKIIALIITLSAVALVSGCAVKTSGVKKIGPDTYTVSADHLNASKAKASVLEQAGVYCANQGQEVLVTKTLKRQQMKYFYDVTFLCLDKGDPRLVSPEYETTVEPR
jgi:putative hemolysin